MNKRALMSLDCTMLHSSLISNHFYHSSVLWSECAFFPLKHFQHSFAPSPHPSPPSITLFFKPEYILNKTYECSFNQSPVDGSLLFGTILRGPGRRKKKQICFYLIDVALHLFHPYQRDYMFSFTFVRFCCS